VNIILQFLCLNIELEKVLQLESNEKRLLLEKISDLDIRCDNLKKNSDGFQDQKIHQLELVEKHETEKGRITQQMNQIEEKYYLLQKENYQLQSKYGDIEAQQITSKVTPKKNKNNFFFLVRKY
jgi:hypothetical protein